VIEAFAALAGGAGAAARFVVDGAFTAFVDHRGGSVLPWATTLINVTGSFALGVVVGLVTVGGAPSAAALIVGTGFLGGYTTFSTASFETVRLARQGRWRAAGVHLAVMVSGTLVAAAAGLSLVAAV